jgi:hypothetical protein
MGKGYPFLHIHPDWPWSPAGLIYHGSLVSFPGAKRPELVLDHPLHLVSRLKMGTVAYLFCSVTSSRVIERIILSGLLSVLGIRVFIVTATSVV